MHFFLFHNTHTQQHFSQTSNRYVFIAQQQTQKHSAYCALVWLLSWVRSHVNQQLVACIKWLFTAGAFVPVANILFLALLGFYVHFFNVPHHVILFLKCQPTLSPLAHQQRAGAKLCLHWHSIFRHSRVPRGQHHVGGASVQGVPRHLSFETARLAGGPREDCVVPLQCSLTCDNDCVHASTHGLFHGDSLLLGLGLELSRRQQASLRQGWDHTVWTQPANQMTNRARSIWCRATHQR